MTLCASSSSDADISAMCHRQCHWYHVMQLPMASHDQKVMFHFISVILAWEYNDAFGDTVSIT